MGFLRRFTQGFWAFCVFGVYCCVLHIDAINAQQKPFSHSAFNEVLTRFVNAQGLVDYKALKAGAHTLETYIDLLARFSPESTPGVFPSRSDSLAYWINAYNAIVLYGVINAYPVASVTKIRPDFGFFKQTQHVVGGVKYTLDQIEHEKIRAQFGDPRIHAAINCAAISCPKLQSRAFLPATLDDQLENAIADMIQSSGHVKIDRSAGVLYLSAIFDWFQSDFVTWVVKKKKGNSLVDYVKVYLTPQDRQYLTQRVDIEIIFQDYNWSLNDQNAGANRGE